MDTLRLVAHEFQDSPPVHPTEIQHPRREELSRVIEIATGEPLSPQIKLDSFRLFRGPSKDLVLQLDEDVATDFIASRPPEEKSATIEKETTSLYQFVKKTLQREANRRRKPYTYHLITEHPKMLAWARTQGQELFEWDRVIRVSHSIDGETDEAPDGYLFEKTFRPEEHRSHLHLVQS